MKEILPNIYVIPVPIDSNLQKINSRLEYESNSTGIKAFFMRFDFELLGTCTKDDIDFDCEGVVDRGFYLDDFDKDHTSAFYYAIQAAGVTDYEKLAVIKKLTQNNQ